MWIQAAEHNGAAFLSDERHSGLISFQHASQAVTGAIGKDLQCVRGGNAPVQTSVNSLPAEPPLPRASPVCHRDLHYHTYTMISPSIYPAHLRPVLHHHQIQATQRDGENKRKTEKEREKERGDKAGSFVFINAIKGKSGSEDECQETREFSSLREINIVPTLCFCCGDELSDAPHGGSSHPTHHPTKDKIKKRMRGCHLGS